MPIFIFTARDSQGNLIHGTQDADTESSAIRVLHGRNLIITKISNSSLDLQSARAGSKKMHRRARPSDLLFFIRQTAILLDAGVSLLRAIELISTQIESQVLQQTLESVKNDIRAGSTFMGAIGKHPKVFPSLWAYFIEAGEVSGNLPFVLNQLSDHLEANMNLRKKIISALVYPSFLITIAIIAVLVFMLKIIPIFSNLFSNFDAKLPPLTLLIIGVSDALRHYFWYWTLGIAATVYFIRKYFMTVPGRRVRDKLMLDLPIFGVIVREMTMSRIAVNLSTLVRSGVNLLQSLDITARASGNVWFESALENTAHDVQQGKSLSSSLGANALFSPMMVNMIAIGEESGQLPDMLGKVAKYYEARADVFVARLGTLIEPVILVVVGGLVGVLVIAMFMPIFSLSAVIK